MLAKRLKSLRTSHRKTQQELADMLGITRQGYAKYENSLSEPDNTTLIKLADYFEVSTDYLLGRTNTPAPLSNQKSGDEITSQAFANDLDLQQWYQKLPQTDEETIKKLRLLWEWIQTDKKK